MKISRTSETDEMFARLSAQLYVSVARTWGFYSGDVLEVSTESHGKIMNSLFSEGRRCVARRNISI
ncbi:MAG: hypothetical protein WA734_01025, partial [Candidatus Acidiferrales bacterium]